MRKIYEDLPDLKFLLKKNFLFCYRFIDINTPPSHAHAHKFTLTNTISADLTNYLVKTHKTWNLKSVFHKLGQFWEEKENYTIF